MTPTDRYADWDSAYVLGALAPAERDEYERHLAGCVACRRAVGELAGLPGLLGSLPAEEALALLEDDGENGVGIHVAPRVQSSAESPGQLAPLLERVRRGRRRRRLAVVASAGFGIAAVLALLLAVVVPALRVPQEVDVEFVTAQSVPISASAELAERDGGTRISSSCSYGAADYGDSGDGAARVFALYVTDADGASEQVASWTAAPGDTVEATGWTDLPLDDIAELDIREAGTADDDALLRAPVS